MRKGLLSGVALILAGASAQAADLPSTAPAAPPPVAPLDVNWTAYYVGGQLGYQFGHDNIHARGLFPVFAQEPRGVSGGAHIGYRYEYKKYVIGLEGDVNGSSYSTSNLNLYTARLIGSRIPVEGSVRGQIGWAIDKILPYAFGGAAFGSITNTYPGLLSPSLNHSAFGWTVGGGVDYAINEHWSARAEYSYTSYGNIHDVPDGVTRYTHFVNVNRVQVGFNYRFGTVTPPAPVLAKY